MQKEKLKKLLPIIIFAVLVIIIPYYINKQNIQKEIVSQKQLKTEENTKYVLDIINNEEKKLVLSVNENIDINDVSLPETYINLNTNLNLAKEGIYYFNYVKKDNGVETQISKTIKVVKDKDTYLKEKETKEKELIAFREKLQKENEEKIKEQKELEQAKINNSVEEYGTIAQPINNYVGSVDSLDNSNPLVIAAKELVGVDGVCSSVVQWAYDKAYPNMVLKQGRVINGQPTGDGYVVSEAEAQIGDLVMWGYSEAAGTDHVALYLGNGMALHGNLRSFGKKAAITGVHLNNMGTPLFFRPNLITKEENQQKQQEEKQREQQELEVARQKLREENERRRKEEEARVAAMSEEEKAQYDIEVCNVIINSYHDSSLKEYQSKFKEHYDNNQCFEKTGKPLE